MVSFDEFKQNSLVVAKVLGLDGANALLDIGSEKIKTNAKNLGLKQNDLVVVVVKENFAKILVVPNKKQKLVPICPDSETAPGERLE